MEDNKRIFFNSVILFVRLCISTAIGIFSSRFVLQVLGASDFGLYNVIGGIVTMLNIINSTLVATTYRYIATELGKGEKGNPNKVFNASFTIHASLGLIFLILGLVLGYFYIDNLLNIEACKIPDAKFVLQLSIITVALSTLMVPFQGLIVAYENFKFSALVDIITQVLRFLAIIGLLYCNGNHLRLYSTIMLAYTLVQGLLYVLYTKKKYYSVVHLKWYNQLCTYKEMLCFSAWNFYSVIATIGKSQGSTLILNFFFGTVVNAAYAIGMQVSSYVQLFANSLTSAAIPQITKNVSSGNIDRSITLTCYISKYSFFLMSIVAFPLILDMDWFLSKWLGNVPIGCSIFCKLIIVDLLLSCMGAGVTGLVQAKGNIKVFQLVVFTLMLLGLPFTFLLYKLGFNVYTISVVYCIISFVTSVLKILVLKLYYKVNIKRIFSIAYLRIAVVAIPLILSYIFIKPFGPTLLNHVLYIIFLEIILMSTILIFGLDRKEYSLIKNRLNKIL